MEFESKHINAIVNAAIKTIRSVHLSLKHLPPNVGTNRVEIERPPGEDPKLALAYDILAETWANSELHKRLPRYKPVIVGEEFGDEFLTKALDFSGRDQLIVLLDMIDGTDLFERNLGNWCSAMVFFHPAEQDPAKRIIAAFVALPDEAIYYARRDRAGVSKVQLQSRGNMMASITGPSSVTDIAEASMAFYGQKIKSLLSILAKEEVRNGVEKLLFHPFAVNLRRLDKDKANKRIRLYNLGGNPMMMRLIDGIKRIDGVLNLTGSAAHDAVPGLYIAQKAGAALRKLGGDPLSDEVLGEKLMKPADKGNRVSYILGSTGEFADKLSALVTESVE